MKPLPQLLKQWYAAVATGDIGEIAALLAEDSVFISPAVHTPQAGKPLVTRYLGAAIDILNNPNFRYVGEWTNERGAILEFETKIGEIVVNGIDMIHWNEAGLIDSFKVMIRPMKALNTIVPMMIERLKPAA
jgi:hypothetical protein